MGIALASVSTCGYHHSVGVAYAGPVDEVRVIKPPAQEETRRQQLAYFLGVSGDTCGATGLAMHLVVVPPGAAAETHYGDGLARSVVTEAGDFLFIPSGVPHRPVNLSATERAVALVARNDASEHERVVPYEPS